MDYGNIILEMLDRIKNLEKEVEALKKKQIESNESSGQGEYRCVAPRGAITSYASAPGKRDTTRYMFEGNVYLKNRLVLAVVQSYVNSNPTIMRQELKRVFDKSLQGSIGVVEDREVAELRNEFQVRFFAKSNEVVHLTDGDMYVCSQWGILNIPNFIKRAEQLGYRIDPIM